MALIRIVRGRGLTPEEAQRNRSISDQIAEELPDLAERHYKRLREQEFMRRAFISAPTPSPWKRIAYVAGVIVTLGLLIVVHKAYEENWK